MKVVERKRLPTRSRDAAFEQAGFDPDAVEKRKGSWVSVFLSEKVLGRSRRKRRSTLFRSATGSLGAAAGYTLGKAFRRTSRFIKGVDRLMRRVRLPLANVSWGGIIALIALGLGVAPPWAWIVFGTALVLTVAGQSARNLLGYAGVIISAAAIAEVIRQGDRFTEILMDFFG